MKNYKLEIDLEPFLNRPISELIYEVHKKLRSIEIGYECYSNFKQREKIIRPYFYDLNQPNQHAEKISSISIKEE